MHENPAISTILEALNNPSLPGIDLSLERVRVLLKALGNPEAKLPPVIHFAGTNGKGSTLAFLRAIYGAAGYRVHVYTSPHLVRFNERIVLAGAEISDDYLLQVLMRVQQAVRDIPVTFFEATTAAAFLAFSEHTADVVLLETGMGGRLDATNVVTTPIATILTPIAYDHKEFLGETLAEIATEKAGILKRDVLCFCGAQLPEAREVIKRTARAFGVQLLLHGREWSYDVADAGFMLHSGAVRYSLPKPALVGAHQYHNAALAVVVATALEQLPVDAAALAKGITSAHWPARLQLLSQGPLVEAWDREVYLDGGHNAHAAAMLAEWMKGQAKPVTLVLGMMARKDAAAFIAPLVPYVVRCFTVPISGGACYAPEDLAALARAGGVAEVTPVSSLDALAALYAPATEGPLLIAGSLFLAGDVLKNHS